MKGVSDMRKWYPLRVTYGREMKLKDLLDSRGIVSFVPMRLRQIEKEGRKKTVAVPAVRNICFVYSDRETIDSLRSRLSETLAVHYIWDKATSLPIVVPQRQMDDFMKVASAIEDDIIFLSEVSPLLRAGSRVRVKAGPFAGIEGRVVRIRKEKRVMVEIPDMLAVATAYIRSEWLENI